MNNNEERTRLSPSLIAWAFAYPNDPVAIQVIARLPTDQVPKLKELFEKERCGHMEATTVLATLLGLNL
jgi:hypothetical protein